MLLPLVALAACGAGEAPFGGSTSSGGFATQLEAPAPDYAQIIRDAPLIEPFEGRREASAAAPSNAKSLGQLWLERLQAIDVVDGYGLAGKDENSAIASIDLRMTAGEFDSWVADNGWQVPPHLRWGFVPPMMAPRTSEAATAGIRIWPSSEQRTGLQLQAADGGRIFLRDGCFYLQRRGSETEQLAWFHTETGLDVDAEGYYVLIDRISGQIVGRLGEYMTWAAPNPITPGGPSREELREACGEGEPVSVGNPVSGARMGAMYPARRAPDAMPPPGIE